MVGDLKTLNGPSNTGIAAIVQASPQSNKHNNSGDSHPNKRHKHNSNQGSNNVPMVYQSMYPSINIQFPQQHMFHPQFAQQFPYFQPFTQQHQNGYQDNGNNNNNNQRKKHKYECDRCGKNNTHDTNGCRICSTCGKKGHMALKCQGPNFKWNKKHGKNSPPTNVQVWWYKCPSLTQI